MRENDIQCEFNLQDETLEPIDVVQKFRENRKYIIQKQFVMVVLGVLVVIPILQQVFILIQY